MYTDQSLKSDIGFDVKNLKQSLKSHGPAINKPLSMRQFKIKISKKLMCMYVMLLN